MKQRGTLCKDIINSIFLALLLTLLSACGGGGGSDPAPATPPPPQVLTGAGVKGPLVNAVVTVYAFDGNQAGFKGAVIDTATTDNSAAISGLALPLPLNPPYIMEITSTPGTTVDITTGQFPVISTLRTVITQALLNGGKPIYATPLTTVATDIAINNADSSAVPYTGNNDGLITLGEFTNALPVAASQLASTLGFGVSAGVDFFDTSPLIDSTTLTSAEQTAVAQYRSAIEALTALVFELAQNIASPAVSADVMLAELTLDLSDGIIDGMVNGSASAIIDAQVLNALSTTNPATLAIPGSDNGSGQALSVDDVEAILILEQSTTGSTTDTSALASIVVTPLAAQPNPDTDADTVLNIADNCPNNPNQNQADSNNNGTGDVCDSSPLAVSESITVNEGAGVSLLDGGASSVLANDSDTENDTLSAVLDSNVSNGSLTLNADGTFSYVHNGSETINDSFTYHANDGSSSSAITTVSISITPQNDAPVALADSITVNQGATVSILDSGANNLLTNDTDAEADSLTAILDSDVSNGSLTLNADGSFSYVHNGSASVSDSFSYHANDGVANSSIVTVSIVIALQNTAPVANADTLSVNEGGTVSVLGSGASSVLSNDTDAQSNALTAVLDSNVSNGSLSLNADGSFSYTQNGSETISDSFSYHANDGTLNSASVTVNITINAQNDAPVAVNDTNSVTEDAATNTVSGNVLANDNDVDSVSLTVLNAAALNNTGSYGSLSISANGSYSYVLNNANSSVNALNAGETLTETYNYTVSDGSLTDSASLLITITGVTDTNTGSVDLSGVWVVTSTVISDTPAGCAGGSGSSITTAAAISQAGNALSVQTLDGATLTGTIDITSGIFNALTGSMSGVEVDLSQPTNAAAFINWQDSFSVSGTGVTATSITGTTDTTETSNGATDCTYSENFTANYSYKPGGTENYNGVYAFEGLENRMQADSTGITQYIKNKPFAMEMEFTATDVLLHIPAVNLSTGNSIIISNSRFDPATGFFSLSIAEKFRIDTDGNPSTIETSETDSGELYGIFLNDPAVNSGSNGNPLMIIAGRNYHRDYNGDVDAGGTVIRSGNRESVGYSKRLTTASKTRTKLVQKSDLSLETRITMGLNNPPLKRVDPNSKLYIEVLNGTTVLCSEPFQTNGSVQGRYQTFEKQPFTVSDFFATRFRGNTYSNLRCNTNDPVTAAERVADSNAYSVRILDTGANGVNDGGTGDDVIAYSTTETASVVAPAERFTQVTDVSAISVNGISPPANLSGDNVSLPGFFSNGLLSAAVINWPAHPEGVDAYEIRIEQPGFNEVIRYGAQANATSRTIDISGTGSNVQTLRLVGRKDVSSNGARALTSSRGLVITKGINGSFVLDLGNTIAPAYKNMQIALQSIGSISSCLVTDNTNVVCNAASSTINYSTNVVSLSMTDITGTLVGAGNTFTLELRFTGSTAASVTSPDSITGLPAVQDGSTSAVLVP